MLLLVPSVLALPSVDQPLRTGSSADTDAAVVIGIEDYADLPDVPYATADAQAVYDLLVYTRGIPASKVKLLTGKVNNEAIVQAVDEAVASAEGRTFVYFAGHGAASTVTGQQLLLGFDTVGSAPSFDSRGVAVSRVVGAGPKVVIVVDACFGAASRTGAPKARGRWVVPVTTEERQWTAAAPNEVAGPLDAAGHGAFTYLMVGALRGWADGEVDGTSDGAVTGEEAQLYVQRGLRALGSGQQTATLAPELSSVVFTRGGAEEGPTMLELGAAARQTTATTKSVARRGRAGWWVADGVLAAVGAGAVGWAAWSGPTLLASARDGTFTGREEEAEAWRQGVNAAMAGGVAALGVATAGAVGIAVVPTDGGGGVTFHVGF